MTRIMQMAGKTCFALASALLFAGTCAAVEASSSAPLASPEAAPALELDEVWVHGKRLADRIEEAEDDFFALYNALNDDDRFDVTCGLVALQQGSMILKRTCIPGFLAQRMPMRLRHRVSFRPPSQFGMQCNSPMPATSQFEGGCQGSISENYHQAMDSYLGDSLAPSGFVPASLEAMHHREQYAQTVMDVIRGDARLSEKAAHLAQLYSELESTQQQYREMKADQPATWSLDRKLGAPGPRGR